MKAIRISLEEIKKMEYDSEVISTIKEKIFPDNSGNGMPNKQHWFTKQVSRLEKFSINQNHQESVSSKKIIKKEIMFSINQNHQESVSSG